MTERARGLGRKKNKRGDRKGELNDSPEIPDRRETSDTPGLPSGGERDREREHTKYAAMLNTLNHLMCRHCFHVPAKNHRRVQ